MGEGGSSEQAVVEHGREREVDTDELGDGRVLVVQAELSLVGERRPVAGSRAGGATLCEPCLRRAVGIQRDAIARFAKAVGTHETSLTRPNDGDFSH